MTRTQLPHESVTSRLARFAIETNSSIDIARWAGVICSAGITPE